jgi:anti-sigma B factor antagonist
VTDAGDQVTGASIAFSGRTNGDTGVLRVDGELDAAAAPELQAQCTELMRRGARTLVLELDGTTFLDSSGLGALLEVERELREGGGELLLRAPHSSVVRLLEITGLADHFAREG